jgi:predicted peptidase
MRNRLLILPIALFAAACSGDVAPTQSILPGDTTGVNPGNPDLSVKTVGWVASSVVDGGVTYKFQIFVPANYNTSAKVPVIMFMHASGQSGTDNTAQTTLGMGPWVKAHQATFPAIAIFPQAPVGEGTFPTYIRISTAALNQVLASYGRADLTRVSLTGYSLGGVHLFAIAYATPTRFAALVPVAGVVCGPCLTGDVNTTRAQAIALLAPKLKSIAMWQFQGALDQIVPVTDVRAEVAAFKAAGSPIVYTEYPQDDHQIGDKPYQQQALYDWIFAQHR